MFFLLSFNFLQDCLSACTQLTESNEEKVQHLKAHYEADALTALVSSLKFRYHDVPIEAFEGDRGVYLINRRKFSP